MLIGAASIAARGAGFRAFDPAAGVEIEPEFGSATAEDVDSACALAEAAFDAFNSVGLERRAQLLEAIAQNLTEAREALVARAMVETGLPQGRLENELVRTTGQLLLFAGVLRDGAFLDVRIDTSLPERVPPRPDLRLSHVPLGPVVVFGASNFPLAFSVAGGDTASALAAGCPVIVKAHPAHPGTSELAGRAIQRAVCGLGLPEGVFSLMFDRGLDVGTALVTDRRIQSVGFTGSRAGGVALLALAQARPQPIPVYAEMSSINPVILLPGAANERGEAIGKSFAAALTLGAGQFCTNPGLILALDGSGLESFLRGATEALAQSTAATMLTPSIHGAYARGVQVLAENPGVETIVRGRPAGGVTSQAGLFATSAAQFLTDRSLREEVFGASSLLIRCENLEALAQVIDCLDGQLTISVHASEDDFPVAARLFPHLERRAGRILFNGFGTGVEVSDAMVHGGPFPATSDGRSTSVGSLAIMRFLRPVCYQDLPAALLPLAVRDSNPLGVPRRVNGHLQLPAG